MYVTCLQSASFTLAFLAPIWKTKLQPFSSCPKQANLPVSVHKVCEQVANGITGFSDSNRFHHTRIPQLSRAQFTIKILQGRATEHLRFELAFQDAQLIFVLFMPNTTNSGQKHFCVVQSARKWKCSGRTSGFLYSLGLTHRMKNGAHWLSVFISSSSDFLNCDPRVGARFRVSGP